MQAPKCREPHWDSTQVRQMRAGERRGRERQEKKMLMKIIHVSSQVRLVRWWPNTQTATVECKLGNMPR